MEQALFFGGPSGAPRGTRSWKADIVGLLTDLGYRGVVFIDEHPRSPGQRRSVDDRKWASYWRRRADVQVCWFPPTAHAGTLEVARLGEWCHSGRVVLGVADGALDDGPALRRWAATRWIPVGTDLSGTVELALLALPPGSLRVSERDVPLNIWHTAWFQGWYRAQLAAGNVFEGVDRIWTYRIGRHNVLFWAFRPRLVIAAEHGRRLEAEIVIGRPDATAVMFYLPSPRMGRTQIVLVRDCRPAARTADGYVWELPGGSGESEDMKVVAGFEFADEVGLELDPGRLDYHGVGQVFPTASAHVTHLWSAKATAAELAFIRSLALNGPQGLHREHEFTFPVVLTLDEILASSNVGWETKGMVASVLLRRR